MKTFALLSIMACLALACSKPTPPGISGAYKMLSQNIKGDTVDLNYTNPQLKVYTNDYMMYTSYNQDDSSTSFGIATYVLTDGGVAETVVFGAAGATASDSVQTFNLAIDRTEKGFKQVITNMSGNGGEKFTLSEEYESVGTDATSALDGVWGMTGGFYVNEKGDTIQYKLDNARQYKVYHAGNFMYGQQWTDSLKVSHAGIGFGTFQMNGDNGAKENVQTSTFPLAVGKTYDLKLTFNGPDEFWQTIAGETANTSSTEKYKRLGR